MEIKCPRNLEILLSAIPIAVFKSLSTEPNSELIEEMVREKYGEVSKEELREEYNFFVTSHSEDLRILNELHKYGETREEIVDNLREHVRGCPDCSISYFNFLIKIINDYLNLPQLAMLGKKYEKNPIDFLKSQDREYLGLLDY